MKHAKTLFTALVAVVALGSSVAAVGTIVALGGTSTEQVKDERVVLGHRIASNGQEMLVYAE